MLLVKTYVASSKIHGLGLFADEQIPKGTITWKFNPAIDIAISKETLSTLPEVVKGFVQESGSLSKLSNEYILSADDTRFTNHSSKPNLDSKIITGEPEAIALANRDIKKHEEITIDYRKFDQLSEKSKSSYLK
jgi:SET domain-containing protein